MGEIFTLRLKRLDWGGRSPPGRDGCSIARGCTVKRSGKRKDATAIFMYRHQCIQNHSRCLRNVYARREMERKRAACTVLLMLLKTNTLKSLVKYFTWTEMRNI